MGDSRLPRDSECRPAHTWPVHDPARDAVELVWASISSRGEMLRAEPSESGVKGVSWRYRCNNSQQSWSSGSRAN